MGCIQKESTVKFPQMVIHRLDGQGVQEPVAMACACPATSPALSSAISTTAHRSSAPRSPGRRPPRGQMALSVEDPCEEQAPAARNIHTRRSEVGQGVAQGIEFREPELVRC